MEQDDQQISILAIVLSVCDAGLLFICCDWRSGALVLMFDVGGGKFVGLGAGHKKPLTHGAAVWIWLRE
ncbi:hypothetical protein [Parasphingorhabdus sp.]|uniref:hypothetical protein n=1 Tax=Parasphingorhabdus sp. TaxID=2709688 RepID=UPI003D274A25